MHFRATVLTANKPQRSLGPLRGSTPPLPPALRSASPTPAHGRASLSPRNAAHQLMKHKTCKQCGQHKPLTDYYLARGTPRERCKACVIEKSKARYRADPERTKASVTASRLADPRVRMAADARARDRRKGLFSDIEAGQIVIPRRCPVLGIPMVTQVGKAVDGSPSIDHVDPMQGAVWGNWRVISRRANQLKGRHSARSLATHIASVEAGAKVLRGRVSLEEYRAVLDYLEEWGDHADSP